MGNNRGKQAAVRVVDEASMSAGERERIERKGQRITRAVRLAKAQLDAASSNRVQQEPSKARWYCLQVANGSDFAVEKALVDAGVNALAPFEKVIQVRKGRKVEADRLFFPGYLLVQFVPSHSAFEALRTQKKVKRFVGNETGYHTLRDADVVVFLSKKTIAIADLPVDKTIGQSTRCRIKDGPLAGFPCVVIDVRWKREARCRVSVEVNGKFTVVDRLPIAFLEKL